MAEHHTASRVTPADPDIERARPPDLPDDVEVVDP